MPRRRTLVHRAGDGIVILDLNRQSSKDSFHNPSFVLTEHPVSV
jgi:hypothetical protein